MGNHILSLTPQVAYLPVGVTVYIDDPSRFVKRYVSSKRFQLCLKLNCTHAVASPKYCGLTNKPLLLVHLVFWYVINSCGHLDVDILFLAKRLSQIILPREPRQHTRFNLR